jgi:hypothetical protein
MTPWKPVWLAQSLASFSHIFVLEPGTWTVSDPFTYDTSTNPSHLRSVTGGPCRPPAYALGSAGFVCSCNGASLRCGATGESGCGLVVGARRDGGYRWATGKILWAADWVRRSAGRWILEGSAMAGQHAVDGRRGRAAGRDLEPKLQR